MAEHQPIPVAGYKPQSDEKIAHVNRHKELEEHLLRIMDAHALSDDVDQRWLAIARTDIEKGFMALNRSIFRPGRVDLTVPTVMMGTATDNRTKP